MNCSIPRKEFVEGQLFIDLYLDEDVDVLVAELLRARGFIAFKKE